MSLVVTALITPAPGRLEDVVAAFREVSPLVHQEPGCELYAAHTDGEVVVIVERWASEQDLDAHANGAALVGLDGLLGDALAAPAKVWKLRNVPIGDPVKGTVQ
jgi:quinol monooxygenase YgiN